MRQLKCRLPVSAPQRNVMRSLQLLGKMDDRDVTNVERRSLLALVKKGFVSKPLISIPGGPRVTQWKLTEEAYV